MTAIEQERDIITEMGMFSLRLVRRLRTDAEMGNEYAVKVLEEESA